MITYYPVHEKSSASGKHVNNFEGNVDTISLTKYIENVPTAFALQSSIDTEPARQHGVIRYCTPYDMLLLTRRAQQAIIPRTVTCE